MPILIIFLSDLIMSKKLKMHLLESISELKYSLHKILIKIMPPFQKKKYKRTSYSLC